MTVAPEVISAAEHRRRGEAVRQVTASWAMEGMHPDRQTVDDEGAYVRGEITLQQLKDRVLARSGAR
jgi:hypothetical protein